MVLCDGENIADFSTWLYIFIYHLIWKYLYIYNMQKKGIIACLEKKILWNFLEVCFCD